MDTSQLEVSGREPLLAPLVAIDDLPVPVEDPFAQFMFPAEGKEPRLQFRSMLPDQLVIPVEDGEIAGGLVLEDTQLGVDVVLIGRIAVEMVLADIQQCGNAGAEATDPLQLEGADFSHNCIHRFPGFYQFYEWVADVTPHVGSMAVGSEYLSDQGGCRCLAVGAGDCHDRCADEAAGKFDLADDLPSRRLCGNEQRMIHRHAGRNHDQVGIQEIGFVMPAEHQADGAPSQLRQHGGQRRFIPQIGGGDPCPFSCQEAGAGHAGASQADYKDFFVFKSHEVRYVLLLINRRGVFSRDRLSALLDVKVLRRASH